MIRTNYWYIVIWRKKDGELYSKKIKHLPEKYKPGYKNSYDHELVYVVDIYDLFYYKKSFRKVLLTNVIDRLQAINKKL